MLVDVSRAKEILKILSDGIDPITGEILPPDNVCNQGEIVRAFYTVLNELDKPTEKRNRNTPENTGKPWKDADEKLLCQMFDSGSSIKELSETFKRTKGSITARLIRLNKLNP